MSVARPLLWRSSLAVWSALSALRGAMSALSRRGGSGHTGRGAAGFTLVEVLVALAIVAITLSAGLKAAGALTDNAQRLGDVVAAQWCADNVLVNLRLARQYPGTGDSDFECAQLGRDYHGRLQTRGTPNPNFRRIDAVVLDNAGHVLVTLSTVVGRY